MATGGVRQSGDRYANFANLAANEAHGIDYRIHTSAQTHSSVAVIAPHGGSIERRTSAIARAIAAEDFNLYLFEGLDAAGSFDVLHITSHRFDEPGCLNLISRCETVVAIHGCGGSEERVMLGGLDRELVNSMERAIRDTGIAVSSQDHAYPGTHSMNVCNRGRSGRGVQLEMSDALRGGAGEIAVVEATRAVLNEFG